MTSQIGRRTVLASVPAAGLAALLGGCAARTSPLLAPGELYRVDDEATILAAARAMVAEDTIASLVTVDSDGMPRVRSVEVRPADEARVFWITTRRSSRKVEQIRGNPNAALHFAFDDIPNGNAGAFYASFMGTASVHTDAETIAVIRPPEEILRQRWPNFPNDFAAIRFAPRWLEVVGKGVRASEDRWQPQAVVLRR